MYEFVITGYEILTEDFDYNAIKWWRLEKCFTGQNKAKLL